MENLKELVISQLQHKLCSTMMDFNAIDVLQRLLSVLINAPKEIVNRGI